MGHDEVGTAGVYSPVPYTGTVRRELSQVLSFLGDATALMKDSGLLRALRTSDSEVPLLSYLAFIAFLPGWVPAIRATEWTAVDWQN